MARDRGLSVGVWRRRPTARDRGLSVAHTAFKGAAESPALRLSVCLGDWSAVRANRLKESCVRPAGWHRKVCCSISGLCVAN